MFKKTIMMLLLAFSTITAMEQDNSSIVPYYENLPEEIIEKIIKEYLKSAIDRFNLPMGENSLIRFESAFNLLIKKARLMNKTSNDITVALKFYAYTLLIQKFNALSKDQKIDCLLLFLQKNKTPLAIAILLSFLNINQMDEQSIIRYLKPRYALLDDSFKRKSIIASKNLQFLLDVQRSSKKKIRLLLEIQRNLSGKYLFDIDYWFKLGFTQYYKGFLKAFLNEYNNISDLISTSVIIEAAQGNLDKIKLINQKQRKTNFGLTAVHWAIIGNPLNAIEILDFLLSDEDIKTLQLQNLQLMLRLATHWSDHKVMEYLLSRFKLTFHITYS